LFAARTDIYATRWENVRAGKAGWLPAVRGGWRKGIRHEDRDYLPLSKDVLRVHSSAFVANVVIRPMPRRSRRYSSNSHENGGTTPVAVTIPTRSVARVHRFHLCPPICPSHSGYDNSTLTKSRC